MFYYMTKLSEFYLLLYYTIFFTEIKVINATFFKKSTNYKLPYIIVVSGIPQFRLDL